MSDIQPLTDADLERMEREGFHHKSYFARAIARIRADGRRIEGLEMVLREVRDFFGDCIHPIAKEVQAALEDKTK